MTRLVLALALLLVAAPAWAPAWAQAPAAVVFKLFRFEATMEADGRGTQTLAIELQANTDQAARQIAQQSLAFTDGMEQLQVLEAYTRKPDGRHIKPAPEAVRVQDDPAAGGVAGFSDRKRVLIAMPEVAAGDVVVLTWRRVVREPSLPGLLGLAFTFGRAVEWTAASVVLDVPASLDIKVEAQDMVAETATRGARRLMRWTHSS